MGKVKKWKIDGKLCEAEIGFIWLLVETSVLNPSILFSSFIYFLD